MALRQGKGGEGRQAVRTHQAHRAAGTGQDFIAKAKSGAIRTRGGARYKPSVLHGYEADLTRYLYPDIGRVRLSELRRRDVQHVVDHLVGRGDLSGYKVRTTCSCRSASSSATRSRTTRSPSTRGRTSASPSPQAGVTAERQSEEAAQLLAAVPDEHRALWATAFYAGLRRGELQALRDEDVDLEANVIYVRRGWDDKEGEIDPKSTKGMRSVPVAGALRLSLLDQRARTGRRGRNLSSARRPTDRSRRRTSSSGRSAAGLASTSAAVRSTRKRRRCSTTRACRCVPSTASASSCRPTSTRPGTRTSR